MIKDVFWTNRLSRAEPRTYLIISRRTITSRNLNKRDHVYLPGCEVKACLVLTVLLCFLQEVTEINEPEITPVSRLQGGCTLLSVPEVKAPRWAEDAAAVGLEVKVEMPLLSSHVTTLLTSSCCRKASWECLPYTCAKSFSFRQKFSNTFSFPREDFVLKCSGIIVVALLQACFIFKQFPLCDALRYAPLSEKADKQTNYLTGERQGIFSVIASQSHMFSSLFLSPSLMSVFLSSSAD
ncbi:hypothetical protein PO909_033393 [Leuciscus waleckii]